MAASDDTEVQDPGSSRGPIDPAVDGWADDWPEKCKVPAWEPWRLSYSWAQVPENLKPGLSDGVQEAGFGRFMIANRSFRSLPPVGGSEGPASGE